MKKLQEWKISDGYVVAVRLSKYFKETCGSNLDLPDDASDGTIVMVLATSPLTDLKVGDICITEYFAGYMLPPYKLDQLIDADIPYGPTDLIILKTSSILAVIDHVNLG